MYIKTEVTYKFLFIPEFAKLDGVYKVLALESYYDLDGQEIDLYELFYKKAGKSKEDWDNDKKKYFKLTFAKLQDVSNVANVVFIPLSDYIKGNESILKEYPNVSIQEYSNMLLSIDLGPTDDPELMKSLVISVAEVIAYTQGIKLQPRLIPYSKVWLTDDEYNKIKKDREKTKRTISNYFAENKRHIEDLSSYGTKIRALEGLLCDLDAQRKIPKITKIINKKVKKNGK